VPGLLPQARLLRRAALACAAVVGSALPGSAAAQPPSSGGPPPAPSAPPLGAARLSWTRFPGAEACPEPGDLSADVASRLGYDPFARPTPRYFIEGRVRATADGYTASLSFRDERGNPVGEREIQTSDDQGCGALARASALAIALVVDPVAALEGPRAELSNDEIDATQPRTPMAERRPADADRPSEDADVGSPTTPTSTPAAGPDEGPALEAQLRLEANGGALPGDGVALGPGLLVLIRWKAFTAGVGALFFPTRGDGVQQVLVDGRLVTARDEVEIGLVAGTVEVCGSPRLADRFIADLCLRGAIGAQRRSVASSAVALVEGERVWGALGPVARLRVRLAGALFLPIEIGVPFTLGRRSVELCVEAGCAGDPAAELVTLWEDPLASVSAAVGLGLAF